MLRSSVSTVEAVLITVIVLIVTSLTIPLLQGYGLQQDLQQAQDEILQALSTADRRSELGERWGVHFATRTVYNGFSYTTRNPELDEAFLIPASIHVSGLPEVSYRSGVATDTGEIVIVVGHNWRKILTVGREDVTVSEPSTQQQVEHHDTTTPSVMPSTILDGNAERPIAIRAIPDLRGVIEPQGPCSTRYRIERDQRLMLLEKTDLTVTALGSYHSDPDAQVRAALSVDGGTTWRSLFGYNAIGTETEKFSGVLPRSTVLVRIAIRQGWLFHRIVHHTETARTLLLRNGSPVPPSWVNTETLPEAISKRISNGVLLLGMDDLLVAVDLGHDSLQADYLDAVLVLTLEKHGACR